MSLKVVPIRQSAVHTPKSLADTLRKLADDVEAGKLGPIERIHALVEHPDDSMTYAPVGKACGFHHRIGVFSLAAMIAGEMAED